MIVRHLTTVTVNGPGVTQSTPATVRSYCEIPGNIGIRTGIPPDTYFFLQTTRPIRGGKVR